MDCLSFTIENYHPWQENDWEVSTDGLISPTPMTGQTKVVLTWVWVHWNILVGPGHYFGCILSAGPTAVQDIESYIFSTPSNTNFSLEASISRIRNYIQRPSRYYSCYNVMLTQFEVFLLRRCDWFKYNVRSVFQSYIQIRRGASMRFKERDKERGLPLPALSK